MRTKAGKASSQDLLSEVHRLGTEVIAPAAHAVDVEARFPHEALDALKALELLSSYVPKEHGGMGLTMTEVCRLCEAMGQYCASTAMIFAMHQIQVACLVHHQAHVPFGGEFLQELVRDQLLLASATTEIGTGGDLGKSICAVEQANGRFRLEKKAPVISYGLEADAILVTSRRGPDAAPGDQVHVIVRRNDTELEEIASWDALGFRGTRSLGFVLRSTGRAEQILPVPFADILAQTMHPFSHMVWGSLWLGLATDAVQRARASLRQKVRVEPELSPISALRLAEVNEQLFSMKSGLYRTIDEYQALLDRGDGDAFTNYGFAVRVNDVKITCSEMVVDIVGAALRIIGISGYKNDSPSSVTRHLRDAHGAALMVNNDRIRGYNATMQVVNRQS